MQQKAVRWARPFVVWCYGVGREGSVVGVDGILAGGEACGVC